MNKRVLDGTLLGVAETAAMLGCSQKSLRGRIARRIVPFRRLGGRIVFVKAELEQFIEELPGVTVSEARSNLVMRSGKLVCR